MELLADRFLPVDDREAIDVATSTRVRVVVSSQGGVSEQARWAARCARLAALRHPALAMLVDYGAIGVGRRFEAWRGHGELDDGVADTVRSRAAALLCALGLTAGGRSLVVSDDDRVAAVPDADAGYDAPASDASVTRVHDLSPALEIIVRPSIGAIADALAAGARQARVFGIWAPEGAGLSTVLLELARSARLQGFVPVCIESVRAHRSLLRGRSLALLETGTLPDAWHSWLELGIRSPRPHLLVARATSDADGAVPVVLERFPTTMLLDALRPAMWCEIQRPRIAEAAREAHGLPAAFARRLWAAERGGRRSTGQVDARIGARSLRVAEPRIEYGSRVAEHTKVEPSDFAEATDASEGWNERRQQAIARIAAGHHAAGERALRQAIGALGRRHAWRDAAEGALALAQVLRGRGRGAGVDDAIEMARHFAAQGGDTALLLRAVVLSGRHAVDENRGDDAEAILSVARATARGMRDMATQRTVALEWARALWWRGRYDEARNVTSALGDADSDERIVIAILRSRIAIGCGEWPQAIAHAVSATEAAVGAAPAVAARAWSAAAHARLMVGDHAAALADTVTALAHAHRAHEPLRVLDIRLLAAEAERRSGRRASAARLVSRYMRPHGPRLPALMRARLRLVAQLLQDAQPTIVLRHIATAGLPALACYVPPPAAAAQSTLTTDLVELLRCCQHAEEDAGILQSLVARFRDSLRVQAAAVFLDDRGRLTQVASAGGRLDASDASRVQAVGDIGPRADVAGGSRGGAAIRWGGEVIGVLAVHWSSESEASAGWQTMLAAAAVAAAPALASERMRRAQPLPLSELLGVSPAIDQVRRAVERAAPAPFAVLINGASGTGKELVARALHRRSPRRDRVCCAVNCAALPDDLLESELFGHARGAFTGAMAERTGVFEEAHGGTLFLDEVGELSPRAQAKLLRAIQEGEIRRVGENTPRRVDVRLVAATNRNLRTEVCEGRFRQDLLYRLDVIHLDLPPLRERAEDIAVLAEHFWREIAARLGSRATLGVATLAALARYDWPGNVRELQNVLAALAVRAPRRGVVPPSALSPMFDGLRTESSWRLDEARRVFEASFVRAALARTGGHRTRAAQELGVTRQGLTKLIVRLGLGNESAASMDGGRVMR